MSRLATSFVLGYHGCQEETAHKAVTQGAKIIQSNKDYDWLGPGAYFWENDPVRALEWATLKRAGTQGKDPAVIGAVIDLGNCLDLTSRQDLELVKNAYESFKKLSDESDFDLPVNESPSNGKNKDRPLRYLDCAVIKHLHEVIEAEKGVGNSFDTVRGLFPEGDHLFPGSGFRSHNHIQIAVRNPDCIKGFFIPPEYLGR